METSASFEARSAPSSYPTANESARVPQGRSQRDAARRLINAASSVRSAAGTSNTPGFGGVSGHYGYGLAALAAFNSDYFCGPQVGVGGAFVTVGVLVGVGLCGLADAGENANKLRIRAERFILSGDQQRTFISTNRAREFLYRGRPNLAA